MLQLYNDYTSVLRQQFSQRVQKITVNAGFTCPNRDGTKGWGGCTYCNNQTFSPQYCQPTKSVREQIEEGVRFFHHKYQAQHYFAYFQSYTNTYGSLTHLIGLYEEALAHPQVIGLVVGTRPDCVSDELLDYFATLARTHYVMIEYGIESTSNNTLQLINRGHSYEEAEAAIRQTAQKGIHTCAHLILGLPGEDCETILSHADALSRLPLAALKLHQLQLVKGTRMVQQYAEHPE
jgi:radical SAM protein (TIGR01212 family)